MNTSINLSFPEIISIIKKLNFEQKEEIAELIHNEQFEIPESHQKIVLERISNAEKKPETLLNWEDVKDSI